MLHREVPVDVPVPAESCDVHASIRYPWIAGEPMSAGLVRRVGVRKLAWHVAAFLRALHGIDGRRPRKAGLDDRPGAGWAAHYEELTAEFADRVVPLLPVEAGRPPRDS